MALPCDRDDDSRTSLEPRRISTPNAEGHNHPVDGFIETAKAFIPVALEIGVVVAAAATNVHHFNQTCLREGMCSLFAESKQKLK